jgi:drug/metabolite transporter (DMT)-like permease
MEILIYICIVLASVTQSASTKGYNRGGGSSLVFNTLKTLSAFLLFLVISLPQFTLHMPTVGYGLLYGASLCLSMYAGYRALCLGPMAITSMLASFSLLMPLFWGIFVRNEAVSPLKGVGLALLLFSLLLVNAHNLRSARKADGTGGSQGLWLLFVAVTFFCNGVCSILQKEHQTAYPSLYNREFMLFAMLLCALVFTTVALIRLPASAFKEAKRKGLGILSGVTNSMASFLTLILAGMENASVLFPIVSAGTILGVLLCGRLVFKEKLKINQYAALALGVLAIVLMKL